MSLNLKILTTAIFSLLLFVSSCILKHPKISTYLTTHSEVKTIDTLEEIQPYIKEAGDGKDIIALWDVDDTLIMPISEFRFVTPFRKQYLLDSRTKFSKDRWDFLVSKIWLKRKVHVVEPTIYNVLEQIQQNGIRSFALTAMYTGKFGAISNIEDWRIKELNNVGFDFVKFSENNNILNFPDLKTDRGIPMLKSGIIFTALADKAIVFHEVLKKLHLRAKTIIFIDDDNNNVLSMQKLCAELGFHFYGFIYTAAKKIEQQPEDDAIERKRFDYLEKYSEWPTLEDLY
jgi:hypothetical protein